MAIRCKGCMEDFDARYDVCPYCGTLKNAAKRDISHITPGTVLGGNYETGLAIGQDRCTITYVGYDLEHQSRVIIKEYFEKMRCHRVADGSVITIDESDQAVFEKGCRIFYGDTRDMMKLNLPGMASVRYLFTENNTVYIVMNYMEGDTLAHDIIQKGRYTFDEAKGILAPVMDTVYQLHKGGMVHCDIQPDNIFLMNSGEVKLMECGRHTLDASRTSEEKNCFQAPELGVPNGKVTSQADIYSMNAVLYRMVTGVNPEPVTESRRREHGILLRKSGAAERDAAVILNGLSISPEKRIMGVRSLLDEFDTVYHGEGDSCAPGNHTMPPAASEMQNTSISPAASSDPESQMFHRSSRRSRRSGRHSRVLILVVLVAIAAGIAAAGLHTVMPGKTHKRAKSSSHRKERQEAAASKEESQSESTSEQAANKESQTNTAAETTTSHAEDIEEGISLRGAGNLAEDEGILYRISTVNTDTGDEDGAWITLKENLTKAGFAVDSELEKVSSNVEKNYIIAIERYDEDGKLIEITSLDENIPNNSRLKFTVSSGRSDMSSSAEDSMTADDMKGMSWEEALQEAETHGFYVSIVQGTQAGIVKKASNTKGRDDQEITLKTRIHLIMDESSRSDTE